MLADMDGGKAGYLRWVLRPLRAAFSMRIMMMTFLWGLVHIQAFLIYAAARCQSTRKDKRRLDAKVVGILFFVLRHGNVC